MLLRTGLSPCFFVPTTGSSSVPTLKNLPSKGGGHGMGTAGIANCIKTNQTMDPKYKALTGKFWCSGWLVAYKRRLLLNYRSSINGSLPLIILMLVNSFIIERFSFECRKVIGFALSTRCDWLKRFAPPFHPIRSKTKANCDALACIFPRFASATCNYFEFWLVQCIVCVLCDWPE